MQGERQLTILLVEDSPDDVFFFRRALDKTGLKAALHVAEYGQEAVDYLTNRGRFHDATRCVRPDVVFIDLKMPGMNGFELLEWMRANFGEIPFRALALTSSDEPQDRKRALDLGAHGYYLKPISPDQIRAAVAGVQAGRVPTPSP